MHAPLTERELLPEGPLRRIGSQFWHFPELDSTNGFLLGYADELPDGTVVTTEFQSAGRGRRGRQWLAPRGSSILLSVLVQLRRGDRLADFAAFWGAAAACEAIERTTTLTPALRWPNDLVLGGRKVGGVLAEVAPRAGDRVALVVGIGINCLQHGGHFPRELAGQATSLDLEAPEPIERGRLGAALLQRLDHWLVRGVGAGLLDAWRKRCHDLGRYITVYVDGVAASGTVTAISPEGDLVLALDTGGRRHCAAATTTRHL